MLKSIITRRVAIVVGAVAILTVGVVATSALAETPTATPEDSTTPAAEVQKYGQVFLDQLAVLLGVDRTKLDSSIKQAADATVDQAVTDGKITQAQADAAKQRIADADPSHFGLGGLFGRGFGKGHGMKPGAMFGIHSQAVIEAIAGKLGITVDELKSELRSGKSLADILGEKGVSEQDLRTAVVDAIKPTLDQAVTDGKLTQAQADEIIQKIQSGELPALRLGIGGFGLPGGRGFGHGCFGGGSGTAPTNPTATQTAPSA